MPKLGAPPVELGRLFSTLIILFRGKVPFCMELVVLHNINQFYFSLLLNKGYHFMQCLLELLSHTPFATSRLTTLGDHHASFRSSSAE